MLTCQFENGGKTSLRHVTVDAVVLRAGQVLLGKRGSYNGKPILESGKWGLLGGYLDRDETVEEAVRREAMEESGWKIDNLQLFRVIDRPDRPKEDRQNVSFVYLAEAVEQVTKTNEEVSALQWFDLDELPPADAIAFDHGETLELVRKYLKKPFPLPLMGENSV